MAEAWPTYDREPAQEPHDETDDLGRSDRKAAGELSLTSDCRRPAPRRPEDCIANMTEDTSPLVNETPETLRSADDLATLTTLWDRSIGPDVAWRTPRARLPRPSTWRPAARGSSPGQDRPAER